MVCIATVMACTLKKVGDFLMAVSSASAMVFLKGFLVAVGFVCTAVEYGVDVLAWGHLLRMKVVVLKFLNDGLYFLVYGEAENYFCWTEFPIFARTQLVGLGKERYIESFLI